MKAVRLHAVGDLRVEEIDDPGAPQADHVRVRIAAAGICGSDLHNFRTGCWMSRAPSTPGHEFVGRVEAIGPAVTGLVVGDRVVADSRVACGRCPACRIGREQFCAHLGFVGEVNDGGFAAFTLQRERQLRRVGDEAAPDAAAAQAEPLAVALHAVNRLAAEASDTVLVLGAGPIGALVALVLRHRGVGQVWIADRNSARRNRVAAVTGASPFDPEAPPAGVHPGAVVDATGSAGALDIALGAVAAGGRLVLVGLYDGAPATDLNAIVERGLTVVGCAAYHDELDEAVALLSPLAGALSALAEPVAPLEAAPRLYAELVSGRTGKIKALIAG